VGALIIVSLLNTWKFMSKTDEFLGEKGHPAGPAAVDRFCLYWRSVPASRGAGRCNGGTLARPSTFYGRFEHAIYSAHCGDNFRLCW
jgi:hypothetical protein